MSVVVAYLVKSILASGLFYLYYQLVLKNKPFHSFNRFYLVAAVLLSAVVPVVNLSWLRTLFNPLLSVFVDAPTTTVRSSSHQFLTGGEWALMACATISLSLLTALAWQIRWVYRMKKTYKNTPKGEFTFIETDLKQAPFSFFKNLFWRQGLSLTDPDGQRIFRHERTHITQKHTHDKLFLQLVSSLFWMNPFYWLIQKELTAVHEFMADDFAVGNGDPEAFASMLLYAHHNGNHHSLSHHFFTSPIKRRLTMIKRSKTAKHSWLRRTLVLPVSLAVVAALSLTSEAQRSPHTSTVPPSTDTVPKVSQEPITVIGYPRKGKAKKPITPPASAESLEPRTVVGHKREKKDGQTQPAKKAF